MGYIFLPAKITPRTTEGPERKITRVLNGITRLPTQPTPQPAQPVDSVVHEIISFQSVYVSMSQILFPFTKNILIDAKSQNPNSGLSDDQAPPHSKSFVV